LIRTEDAAWIHADARIADDVEIGPFTSIGPHVEIGRGTVIGSHCTITGHTRIGANNKIVGHSVIGGAPQDLKYKGEATRLEIGDRNQIREFVTINVGTVGGGGVTRIGNDNMIMACAHIAHDCIFEDRIILANNCLLGGHIYVESDAIISGGSVVHHFATVGQHSFIGGMTRVSRDVPPYMIFVGAPPKVLGVNIVGLKRRGYTHDAISALKEAHRYLFRSALSFNEAVEECRDLMAVAPEIKVLVEAMRVTQNGKFGRAREALRDGETEA